MLHLTTLPPVIFARVQFRRRASSPVSMSPLWGLGRMRRRVPLTMNSCLPPG
jgi:hypothetical protein